MRTSSGPPYAPTLFVSPTSLPHQIDTAATAAAKSVTTETEPMIVGKMDDR